MTLTESCCFKGGIITAAARGHSGDKAGRCAIFGLLKSGEAEQTGIAVYGCPLFNKNSACALPQ